MTVYSHSRLSTFESCPLKYKFNYIDKIEREEEGVEAFLGSRFHEAMEKLYKDLKCKVYTLKELLSYYDTQWQKEWSDAVVVTRKDRTAADYKNIGRKCIEDYYKRYHPFDQGRVLGLERSILIDLDTAGKHKLRGFIDRIAQAPDDTYEIHDYKTSGYLPDQKHFDEDRQLALYQIGIGSIWNDVKKAKLIWHYVVFDKEMASTRTKEQLEELKTDTVSLIDQIESTEEFLPKESGLCEWCTYPDLCPKRKHLFKVAELPVNEYKKEPGVKLVSQYELLEKEKSGLKEKILVIEEEQSKIAQAAVSYAEKEGVSVIDGPNARLKVEIKEELKAPTKTEDLKAWEGLHDLLIKEGKYMEVSTVNNNMLNYRIKTKAWGDELMKKVKKFLKEQVTKTVKLVKKREE